MPSRGPFPRLPTYTSRTLSRYHPYPRVRRRYDQLNRSIVRPVYEDNVGEPLLDLPPSVSLRPLGVVGTTSNETCRLWIWMIALVPPRSRRLHVPQYTFPASGSQKLSSLCGAIIALSVRCGLGSLPKLCSSDELMPALSC